MSPAEYRAWAKDCRTRTWRRADGSLDYERLLGQRFAVARAAIENALRHRDVDSLAEAKRVADLDDEAFVAHLKVLDAEFADRLDGYAAAAERADRPYECPSCDGVTVLGGLACHPECPEGR